MPPEFGECMPHRWRAAAPQLLDSARQIAGNTDWKKAVARKPGVSAVNCPNRRDRVGHRCRLRGARRDFCERCVNCFERGRTTLLGPVLADGRPVAAPDSAGGGAALRRASGQLAPAYGRHADDLLTCEGRRIAPQIAYWPVRSRASAIQSPLHAQRQTLDERAIALWLALLRGRRRRARGAQARCHCRVDNAHGRLGGALRAGEAAPIR